MFVLALDTSSPAVAAGLVSTDDATGDPTGDQLMPVLLAGRAPLAARGHGELLAPAIAECLQEAGLAATDVDAVVAGVGPGPYTGLRVGLVSAAAFADAVGVPTFGVCSLDALAVRHADERPRGPFLVATDARRREVYWARYAADGARLGDPDVGAPGDVPVDGLTAVAGAAGELYADVWPELARSPHRYPDPVSLVRVAADRLPGGRGEALTPLYLRRPDAVVPGAPKRVGR